MRKDVDSIPERDEALEIWQKWWIKRDATAEEIVEFSKGFNGE